jgi:enolase-phosphatase E1
MKYILTDIEGTTTSISFVHDTLFPFAKKKLTAFIANNLDNSEVQNILDQTKNTAFEENQKIINNDEACELLLDWITIDRKHPALKNLQGLIWEEGYRSGAIKGHIYKDVLPALKAWTKKGLTLGVYSSGSVKAQHLIFEFSIEGNLKPYFKNNFDTAIGHKREVDSYVKIASQLGLLPEEILFLSDIKEELDAASAAGLKTIQLVRQPNVIIGDHKTVSNFGAIEF